AAADEHEPGERVPVVTDVISEHVEVVVLVDSGRGDGGICGVAGEQGCGRGNVRRGGDVPVAGQVLLQPAVGLGVGDRMRVDSRDIGERRAAGGNEHEVDGD